MAIPRRVPYPVRRFPLREFPPRGPRGPPRKPVSVVSAAQPKKEKGIHVPVLGYVIAGIVVVILLVLIFTGGSGGEGDEIKNFKEVLQNDLSSSVLTGAVIKTYVLPEGYGELCFVDLEKVDNTDIVDNVELQRSVSLGDLKNVFLFGKMKTSSFYLPDLVLINFPYYSCVKMVDGGVEVKLESGEDGVSVTLHPSSDYCRNAEDIVLENEETLCNYLDDVYYLGYKEACCNLYGYCC